MKNQKPLVSILLSVHNSEKHLAECFSSLISQSYKNIEIIAIDDKSTDDSLKILQSFRRMDKRIKIFQNVKRYGISMTLNRAIKRANGQFITIMDSRDVSLPTRIKKQVKYLLENPTIAVLGTQCFFLNEFGKKVSQSNFPDRNSDIYASPHHGIGMQFETAMINRYLLPKDILKFKHASHPFIYSDLLMKILPYSKFANLNEPLYYHRRNPNEYLHDLQRNLFSLVKLWVKSIANYNYNPINKSFFTPLIRMKSA